jgi:hypothetical protein
MIHPIDWIVLGGAYSFAKALHPAGNPTLERGLRGSLARRVSN